jgi:DNA-binding transcriptional MerR regulator
MASGDHPLTIEQLAAESGMTVRNIRAHRARGLLPAPEVRDRTGYYGPEHLARLRLISQMQGDGFNLRAIERLLEQTNGRPEQLLSLREVLSTPIEAEQPRVFTVDELVKRFGDHAGPQELARAEKMGLLVQLGDGRIEAPLPSLLDAAEEVVSMGVPLSHALKVLAKVQEQCRLVAREFVNLYLEDLWEPFAADGYPDQRWQEVTASIERLLPLSASVIGAAYQLTMIAEVEQAFGRELARLTRRKRPAR